MSLFINNHNGPIYHECNVTIHQDAAPSETPQEAPKEEPTAQPSVNDILPIPHEGKYSEVRRYIEERKRFDEEFKTFVETHSRVELCIRLSNEFGWDVDDHHLGVNINRNRNK